MCISLTNGVSKILILKGNNSRASFLSLSPNFSVLRNLSLVICDRSLYHLLKHQKSSELKLLKVSATCSFLGKKALERFFQLLKLEKRLERNTITKSLFQFKKLQYFWKIKTKQSLLNWIAAYSKFFFEFCFQVFILKNRLIALKLASSNKTFSAFR